MLGLPNLATVSRQDGWSAAATTYEAEAFTLVLTDSADEPGEARVFAADGQLDFVITLAHYRDFDFGRYPSEITRYVVQRDIQDRRFDKRFHLLDFQWLDEPLTAELLLPAQLHGSVACSQVRLGEVAPSSPPFVLLTRSNEQHVLKDGEWVAHTPLSAAEARAVVEPFLPRGSNWMGLLILVTAAASGPVILLLLKRRNTNQERQ